jgi:parallel beta-helix repeat protein
MATLVDSQTTHSNQYAAATRFNNTTYRCAVRFIPGSTFDMDSVKCWLRRQGDVGDPAGSKVWVEVWNDDTGLPDAIVANGKSSEVVASNLIEDAAGGEVEFTWATPPTLTASATYFLVLDGGWTLGANRGVWWHGNGPDTDFMEYAEGAGGWAANANDTLYLAIYSYDAEPEVPGTYYMRSDGSAATRAAATGPTTDAAACMNVTVHNAATFVAGDTVVISSRGGNFNSALVPPTAGSVGLPIVYEGEASYNPVFDGQDTRAYCILTEKDYLTFEDITASNATYGCWRGVNPGSNMIFRRCTANGSGESGFILGDSTQTVAYTANLIEDCIATDNAVSGIAWNYEGTNCIIRRNKCYENGLASGAQWTAGIKCYDDTDTISGFQIYDNECYDNGPSPESTNQGDGVGIWMDNIKATSGTEMLIFRNYVHGNAGNGIFVEISDYCNVYSNLCVNNGTNVTGDNEFMPANIAIDTRDVYTATYNKVYNNTCVGGRAGIKTGTYSQDTCALSNNEVKNNVVVGATEHNLIAVLGGNNVTYGTGNVYNKNCFGAQANDFIRWGDTYCDTYDAFIAASSQTDNNIESAPSFANEVGSDYSLNDDSPCIDSGTDLGVAFDDGLDPASAWTASVAALDQDDYGSGWEVGAYVYDVTEHELTASGITAGVPSVGSPALDEITVYAFRLAGVLSVKKLLKG